jgi:hypothetical protein
MLVLVILFGIGCNGKWSNGKMGNAVGCLVWTELGESTCKSLNTGCITDFYL